MPVRHQYTRPAALLSLSATIINAVQRAVSLTLLMLYHDMQVCTVTVVSGCIVVHVAYAVSLQMLIRRVNCTVEWLVVRHS